MRSPSPQSPIPRRHCGMSLIEVLISLVILSLGVLAVVALQLVSKRSNADAGQRSIAAQMAYDILERMRANSTQAGLAAYVAQSPLAPDKTITLPKDCGTASANCTDTEIALYDLKTWHDVLKGTAEQTADGPTGGLASPTACIAFAPVAAGNSDGVYTVTIVWRSRIELPDRTAAEIADNSALGCGQDPQPAGADLYSKVDAANDNVYRRLVSLPTFITARR